TGRAHEFLPAHRRAERPAVGDGRQPGQLRGQQALRPRAPQHDRGPHRVPHLAPAQDRLFVTKALVAAGVSHVTGPPYSGGMPGPEDLEQYETEIELQLYQEYRAVLPMF